MTTSDPVLWYLNRSTGLVVLALLTATALLGIVATGRGGRVLPRFVGQRLHRDLALWSVVLLTVHVATAVTDTYVDIRWWQSFVPWVGATYLPLWLGFGTLALDVIALVTVTSLLRTRLGRRRWHAVHLLAYGAWGAGVAHGLGIGTDLRTAGWERTAVWASVCLVAVAAVLRVGRATVAATVGGTT
jgi:methionine sulfoxide reductase heme-binding subunit